MTEEDIDYLIKVFSSDFVHNIYDLGANDRIIKDLKAAKKSLEEKVNGDYLIAITPTLRFFKGSFKP